jgi:hypothetical protein
MKRLALGVLIAASLAVGVRADEPQDRLTEAKVQADLGNRKLAAEGFALVANDPAAPASLRAEALVRLGVCQRAVGDLRGSIDSFQRVMAEHGDDQEAVRLLAEAVSGVSPEPARWEQIWRDVRLVVDPPRPTPRIVWPLKERGAGRASRGACDSTPNTPSAPISLDFKDADLGDAFRLLADITGLNVVVAPGVSGRFSAHFDGAPWPQALDNLVASMGYSCHVDGPVLLIGQPEVIAHAKRTFTGKPIDVDYFDKDLVEVLQSLAQSGGLQADIQTGVSGLLTMKLERVPWDQALDVVVLVNGLEWKRDGNVVRVTRPQP